MALIDVIRQKSRAAPAPTSAATLGQQAQTLATGKAGLGGGSQMSNLQSQLAAQAGQAQGDQIAAQSAATSQQQVAQGAAQTRQFDQAQQAQQMQMNQQQQQIVAQQLMADRQRTAQEQSVIKELQAKEEIAGKQLSSAYANSLADLASRRGVAEQDIFSELKMAQKELTADEYRARLDQTAHVLAMADQKYLDEIRRIGQMNNMMDQAEFSREAQEIAFGQDMQILGQQFHMQSLTNEDARSFQREMANMSLDTAMKLAEQAMKEQAYSNMITGATNVTTGLIAHNWGSSGTEADYSQSTAADWQAGQSLQTQPTAPSNMSVEPTSFTDSMLNSPLGG